eukprot:11609605-Prorocentrum_lima.AAC.1
MTSSLVGSEMCIRDRDNALTTWTASMETQVKDQIQRLRQEQAQDVGRCGHCLLYTSDAADDM